jgi:ubiquinone/menaquinone biosynthesis C-methylase UbiE
MVTTVCFLDDIDLAFQEAHRVLKPNGSFLVAFVDKDSPLGRSYEEKKNQSLFYKDATFYSVPTVAAHLAAAGFQRFLFAQTLFHQLSAITAIEPVQEGYGSGSFVVIKAEK